MLRTDGLLFLKDVGQSRRVGFGRDQQKSRNSNVLNADRIEISIDFRSIYTSELCRKLLQ